MNSKVSCLFIVFLLLIGCSNHSAQNPPNNEVDPISWITFEGKKYEFYKTHVSIGDSIVSTNEKTDTNDGTELGLEIFKIENDKDISLFIQDPFNQEWVEYRIK